MFGSSVLDIAIGTTFVCLMVALGVTAANELLSSVLRWRAQNLAAGLREILSDPNGKGLKQELYKHPLIRSLYRGKYGPSYIPSRLFAIALLDLFAPAEPGKPRSVDALRQAIQSAKVAARRGGGDAASNKSLDPVKRVLLVLLERAEHDCEHGEQVVVRLEQYVELWFNNAMDRVAGWYKRRLQLVSLFFAALLAVGLNIDQMRIVRGLSRDAVLRAAVTAQVTKLVQAPPPYASLADAPAAPRSAGQSYAELSTDISRLTGVGIPMGWAEELSEMEAANAPRDAGWALSKLFGLMLTTLAALLGAPFWFDVLNRIVSVRSAVKAAPDAPSLPIKIAVPAEIAPRTEADQMVMPLATVSSLSGSQEPTQ